MLAHRDRLTRFGYEWFEHIAHEHGCERLVLNQERLSPEQEMVHYVPRTAGLDKPNAVAIGYEIGIHNSTLAIFVAVSVLGDFQLMVPAAIYSISMYVLATAFGVLVLRRHRAGVKVVAASS